ncbi:MAG: hypothetical protein ABI851_00295 [Saprospiraceae bacterium]
MINKLALFFLLLLSNCNGLLSQFNFQVGYGYHWSELNSLNKSIDIHNVDHSEYSKSLESIHGLHGISIGIRHQFEILAPTFLWSNQINKNYSIVPVSLTNTKEIKSEYFYKLQSYSLGLETVGGLISVGGTIDLRRFNIKNRMSGTEGKNTILEERQFGNTFYAQFDFPASRRMGLLFRLSYSFPWSNFNLNSYQNDLNPNKPQIQSTEKFHQIGISLIFSNGFQNRY